LGCSRLLWEVGDDGVFVDELAVKARKNHEAEINGNGNGFV
jgi:hypothetical protein